MISLCAPEAKKRAKRKHPLTGNAHYTTLSPAGQPLFAEKSRIFHGFVPFSVASRRHFVYDRANVKKRGGCRRKK
jgi:hypothetical protein